ncbi:TonB-dependent receptor plug domain-containing protein [Endomicrobium proavitum]|uniref:Vitamin B12/cobalamin outer membrane transporter n=1 Tax=Endomicrobium proavitum TaxID=1408281 RepID=A0A0G3WIS3_9BACT|nr:TonB-dependent receptor [Endomicrobium proavitum]AKL97777.1 vitamin B12/cobalamin outer membrane transporter [Endomicrobium proavitum]
MKKLAVVLCSLLVFSNVGLAQEVFLSLTKQEEDIKDLPANVTVIEKKAIEESHAQTLGELLETQAGVDFRSNGTVGAAQSISIRGASSLQTLVLIDGRKVNDAGLGSADFSAISVSVIEKIEIIRGAGAAIYGAGAFGGVINIITKKAKPGSFVDVGFSYGSFDTSKLHLTEVAAGDNGGILVSFDKTKSNGSRENSKYDGDNIFFNGLLKTSKNSELTLTGNVFSSNYGTPGATTWLTADNTQKDSNRYIKADYSLKTEAVGLNISGYSSNNDRDYNDIGGGNPYDPTWMLSDAQYKYNSEVAGGQIDFHYKNLILLGAELADEIYKEKEELTGWSSSHSRKNYAAYAQLNLKLWKLSLIPGVRYDNNSQFGTAVTPSVSAVFSITDNLKFSGNAGKVWRAPAFTELYWDQPSYDMYGNPNLVPEKGNSFDFGIEYFGNKIKLSADAFYIKSKDLIAWVFDPSLGMWGETHVQNINSAVQYGAEFSAGIILMPWLSNTVGYAYLEAKDEDTKKALPYKPQHTVSDTLTIKPFRNFSLSATAYFKDKVWTNAANTTSLKNFITLDVNVNYDITKAVSLWAKGVNVTETKYEMSSGYPMPGAAVYGGVNVKILE